MAFYLKIDGDQQWFGGLKSIPKDWAHISQTRNRTFTDDNGDITIPTGIWLVGSSVTANMAKGRLDMRHALDEDYLTKLSSDCDVKIFLATVDKVYLYRNGARVWVPIKDGFYRKELDTTADVAEQAMAGCGCAIPKHWSTAHTYFNR